MENWLDILPNEILSHINSFLEKTELLICMGGYKLKSAEYLHETEWKPLPDMLAPRGWFNALTIENVIFVLGGYSSGAVSTMESFDFQSTNWQQEQQMITARVNAAAVNINVADVHSIVVVGGRNSEYELLKTAEMFNTRRRKWKRVANMREKRARHCAVTFEDQIFVFGGFDGQKAMSTCETYIPVKNKWYDIPNMLGPRFNAAAAVANSKIFIAGGNDGKHRLASVNVFDPLAGIWVNVTKMNSIRDGLGLATFGSELVAVGGDDDLYQAVDQSIEFYNIAEDSWIDGPTLGTGRTCCGLTTVAVDQKLCHKNLFK